MKKKQQKDVEKMTDINDMNRGCRVTDYGTLIDKNGEPAVLFHHCSEESRNTSMRPEERLSFAIDIVASACFHSQMKVIHTDKRLDTMHPHLVLDSRNGKRYYLSVFVSMYPENAPDMDNRMMRSVVELASLAGAIPCFVILGLMNATEVNESVAINGAGYFARMSEFQLML